MATEATEKAHTRLLIAVKHGPASRKHVTCSWSPSQQRWHPWNRSACLEHPHPSTHLMPCRCSALLAKLPSRLVFTAQPPSQGGDPGTWPDDAVFFPGLSHALSV